MQEHTTAAHGVRNKIKQWKCYWKNIAGGLNAFVCTANKYVNPGRYALNVSSFCLASFLLMCAPAFVKVDFFLSSKCPDCACGTTPTNRLPPPTNDFVQSGEHVPHHTQPNHSNSWWCWQPQGPTAHAAPYTIFFASPNSKSKCLWFIRYGACCRSLNFIRHYSGCKHRTPISTSAPVAITMKHRKWKLALHFHSNQ